MVCDPSASAVAETITIRIVGDEGSIAPKLVESHVARAHTELAAACEQQQRPECEADLERDDTKDTVQPRILREQTFVDREDLRE